MRILYLIDTLSLGGAQTVLKGIFENQKDNNDIFIYALRKTQLTVSIYHPNVFIDRSNVRYSLSPFFRLKKFVKENQIEVLHCQLPRSHVFGYFLKKYFKPKIKLIIHEQGDIFESFTLHSHFLRKAAGFTSLFIACSNAARKKLILKAGIQENKAVTIYNFVDLEKFDIRKVNEIGKVERQSRNIDESTFVFGFAGRLIERKGWREFFLSATEFKEDNVKFIIAGAGEDEAELKQLILESGSSEKIIYLGYFDDMLKFYSLIDCLIVPSHWEPMGITEIEAMALGIPVIAANVPGLNEVVKNGETGLLFNAKDIKSLENSMVKVYSDKFVRSKITKNAFNGISEFSYIVFREKLDNIYRSL